MLDYIRVQQVHFFGESTNGMIAMAFAALYPNRVSSITLCPSPTHPPVAAREFFAFGMESWPTACRELGSYGWA